MLNRKAPTEILCKVLDCPSVKCVPLTEDGSNRQYFRVLPSNQNKSYILMQIHGQDALDLKTGSYSWITIGKTLENNGVFVPKIHNLLKDFDSLFIEDLGDTTLDLKVSSNQDENISLYKLASKLLYKFYAIQPDSTSSWSKRGFDYFLLHRELEFFRAQFLDTISDFKNSQDSTFFSKEIESLSRYLSKIPQYFTHRDFHSRNLLYFNDTLGVIDFQDARWGPAAYDLCSLCFDPYVSLSLESRKIIFDEALRHLEHSHKNGKNLKNEILDSWQAVTLQRFLKAIGSFAFLTKKGKRDYRIYINPTLLMLNEILSGNRQWPYLTNELIPRLLKLSNEKTT